MTRYEVINKLAAEFVAATHHPEDLNAARWFIRQALTIGSEHFQVNMHEVIQLDKFGMELHRYKSTTEAWEKTGASRGHIRDVVEGRRHSAGGFGWKYAMDEQEHIPDNEV